MVKSAVSAVVTLHVTKYGSYSAQHEVIGVGEVAFRSDGVTNLCPGAVFELKAAGPSPFGSGHRMHERAVRPRRS